MKVVAAFAVIALSLTCAAQAASDPALKSFIVAFSDVLRRGDAAAALPMAHFPLGNAVHQSPEKVTQADFKWHFKSIQVKSFIDCLKKEAPQRASANDRKRLGEWLVECDGNIFYFTKFDGQWRYSGFENVNE